LQVRLLGPNRPLAPAQQADPRQTHSHQEP
jgi:hypothetical protein